MTVRCPKCDFENTDTARFCSNCVTSLQPTVQYEKFRSLWRDAYPGIAEVEVARPKLAELSLYSSLKTKNT